MNKLAAEIQRWKASPSRLTQLCGEQYYIGIHDILLRQRTVIGKDGALLAVATLPNNKLVDNQYAKMVDQKVNYLLGKPFAIDTDDAKYERALSKVFTRKFQRTLQNVCEDSLNCGVGWLHPYYDEAGRLAFKRFDPVEILPFWQDSEHTKLLSVARVYEVEQFGEPPIEKVELYRPEGVTRYTLSNGVLVDEGSSAYITVDNVLAEPKRYGWQRVPVIAFKYNDKELPLIRKVKPLQDAINTVLSDFENNMQEDSRNTILILKNYDGQNLGEFRHNLATYGAVKVKTVDGAEGDVSALQVTVDAANYKELLSFLKTALIENAMGYDAKDDKLSGTPNQMNIQSMYSDIDLDANGMETEFQASLEDLMWFINAHLVNTGVGDFSDSDLRFIFNRDMLMNESEIMSTLVACGVELSNETLVSQVPFIDDVKNELERLKLQKQNNDYVGAFTNEY
jgi:SPP1 family phage portal protein